MRADSAPSAGCANRQRSTPVAFSEKMAKLTPTPSQEAPSGHGSPGQTRTLAILEPIEDTTPRQEGDAPSTAAPAACDARRVARPAVAGVPRGEAQPPCALPFVGHGHIERIAGEVEEREERARRRRCELHGEPRAVIVAPGTRRRDARAQCGLGAPERQQIAIECEQAASGWRLARAAIEARARHRVRILRIVIVALPPFRAIQP